ncbi:MAG: aminotransferase class I/II-fold pyridoxal phosphate-dependent enzyme [Bacteroidales bacterium]|nr:aminotransferase class I/II-fold pyridoxal phosphate-dependent enzyme [Bacteroidales bacterium]
MLRSKLPEGNYTLLNQIFDYAEKDEVIDFATPLPDCNIPQEIKDLVVKYIKSGKNQYAPNIGIPELRTSVCDYYFKRYSHKYTPEDEVTVTEGATEAIWAAITAVVHEDDEVIIIEPAAENYVPAVRINGGIPVFVAMKAPDYTIDWNEVIMSVNQRTKMIIISTPHIPTGKLLSDEDFRNLQKIIVGSKITVLCDESFSNICFEGQFTSISKFPLLTKQTVLISSLSRGFNTTGWKSGFCIAPKDYTVEIRKIHNYICNSGNSALQYAMSELLNTKAGVFDIIRQEYRAKRDLLCTMLQGSKYKLTPSQGTWFQTVDCSEVTDQDNKDFALRLAKEYGVAVIPMSAYYHDKNRSNSIRICFARPDEIIRKGVERLIKAQKK